MNVVRTLRLLIALVALLCVGAADPAARTLTLRGTLTNTTADGAGPATLVLTIAGEKATATLKTEPPLSGSGKLEGRFRHGWCELGGQLDEGFRLQMRGALNARDFRGTYVAAVPGQPVQYGKFQLTVAPQEAVGSKL